jgi:hypothetical protein
MMRSLPRARSRGVNLLFGERQVAHRAVNIPIPEGALGFHQVMIEPLVDPIRKGLAHAVGAQFSGELVRGHGLMQNLSRLKFADRLIDALPALKHVCLGRHARRLLALHEPHRQRRLRLGMQRDRPPWPFGLHMPALDGHPIDHPAVLVDIPDAQRQQFRDPKARFDAEEKEGAIPRPIGSPKAALQEFHLLLTEWADSRSCLIPPHTPVNVNKG